MDKRQGMEQLQALCGRGAFAHAYLIGGATDETDAAAWLIAQAMVCAGPGDKPCHICAHCRKAEKSLHPDIITLDLERDGKGKEKREITVGQIRALTDGLYTLPNEADRKVYVIRHADCMNASAQNALLKALEEPPAYGAFLLLSENPQALLPTIRSRCAILRLTPRPEEGREPEALTAAFMEALSEGALALAAFCVGLERQDRAQMERFIDDGYRVLTDRLKDGGFPGSRETLLAAVGLFDRLRGFAEFYVSVGHMSGMIMAALIR